MQRLLRPILVAICLALPLPAMAEEPMDRAVQATRALLDTAHRALTETHDVAALRGAIEEAFAFDVWERFLIEDRADSFNEAQRAEFRALLPGFMANLYVEQFDRGLDEAPTVGKARKVRRDYLVETSFKRRGGRDLPVEWRLREFPDERSQVIDMMVGGASFLILKREEFHAIIDRSGADGMLNFMRERSR